MIGIGIGIGGMRGGLDAADAGRATFAPMRSSSFIFAHFWFSHRPADGEAGA